MLTKTLKCLTVVETIHEGMLNDLLGKYVALHQELRDYPVKPIVTTDTKGPLETALPIAEDILNLMEDAQDG